MSEWPRVKGAEWASEAKLVTGIAISIPPTPRCVGCQVINCRLININDRGLHGALSSNLAYLLWYLFYLVRPFIYKHMETVCLFTYYKRDENNLV